MKKLITFIGIIFIVNQSLIIGQDAEKLMSKSFVERTKSEMKSFYNSGRLEELNRFLVGSINDCERFSDVESCLTNLSFMGGYYFHQASKEKDYDQENNYIQLSEDYYKQVLLFLPENKAAQNNLSNLYQLKGLNESSVGWYQSMAEKYPNQKASYLIKLADLYAHKDGNSAETSNYLWEAYSADPYNRDIYDRIIDLYKKEARFFENKISLTNFAHRSQKFGFPNFGEELLRQQVINSFSSRTSIDSERSIIAWINILVDNNWISNKRIESFIENNIKILRRGDSRQEDAKGILSELSYLLRDIDSMRLGYWVKSVPEIIINEEGDLIRPIDITIKILFKKGETALFANDPVSAERFWKDALSLCQRSKNLLYPKIANDLAKLYYTDKKIDNSGRKLEKLVKDLFEAKGGAYRNGDKDLIKECHTTLGEIYYNLEKWDGGWATNAKFQLERALGEYDGPITNPDLREMLAVTYERTKKFDMAQESYHRATMDLLKIDKTKDARSMLSKATTLNNQVRSRDQKRISGDLAKLILFREGKYSLEGNNLTNKIEAETYLDRVDLLQQELNSGLDPDFVSSQLFKGLTDIGTQLPETNNEVKQIIYSSALTKISSSSKLESVTDYDRINNIKTVLEKDVNSNQLKSIRLNSKSKITQSNLSFYTNYKTFQVQGLEIQVQVPIYLFELNNIIIADQKSLQNKKTTYKYDGRKIEKINYR